MTRPASVVKRPSSEVRLGHSDIRITMNRYGHLFSAEDMALADALDAAFRSDPGRNNVAEIR